MGKRDALGNAYPPLPPYRRIPVAGRTYCSRDTRRSRNRSKEDAGSLCRLCRKLYGDAGHQRCQICKRKALQAGTSHFLGQNFGKAFDVTFIDKNGKSDYAWATSWGVSTRLIGALIMSHSDDNGLVLPPHLAPIQVVIIPIYRSTEQLAQISEKVNGIVAKLKALGISVKFDDADNKKPGWKFAEYELKGVPVRLAMGGRDLENNTIEVMRRDTLEKETVTCDNIETYVQNLLEEIQKNIFQKALDHRTEKTITVDTYEEFKEKIEEGYFIMAHWDGTPETEEQVKNETKATIRCIPLEGDKTPGKCMVTGRPSAQRVLFARAY